MFPQIGQHLLPGETQPGEFRLQFPERPGGFFQPAQQAIPFKVGMSDLGQNMARFGDGFQFLFRDAGGGIVGARAGWGTQAPPQGTLPARGGGGWATGPNQYIGRRGIKPYGPGLEKPYDFYSWVSQAREEIKARGEQPVTLAAEPTGSEIIAPPRRGRGRRGRAEPLPHGRGSAMAMHDSDPQGKITREVRKMVEIETMVTPARVQPGQRVRVRTLLRLDERSRAYWNNEAGGGVVRWVDVRKSLKLGECERSSRNTAVE